jgi:hypothetical protein
LLENASKLLKIKEIMETRIVDFWHANCTPYPNLPLSFFCLSPLPGFHDHNLGSERARPPKQSVKSSLSMAVCVVCKAAQRTIDNDDSVVGVGARSGVWTWKRDSVSAFSANKLARAEAAEKIAPCR